MVTMERARAVKKSLLPELVGKRVSAGIALRKGEYVVVLDAQDKFPEGTFPTERDGVTIVTKFIGDVSAD